jgi:hypothetical protein
VGEDVNDLFSFYFIKYVFRKGRLAKESSFPSTFLTFVLPNCFRGVGQVVDKPGEHEQVIRESVEINDDIVADGRMMVQGDGVPFSSAAHVSGKMKGGGARVASRKYERG